MRTVKDYHKFHLKFDVSLLTDTFEKLRNSSLKKMEYVRVIIWAHQLYVGLQCLMWQKLSFNLFQMLTCSCSLKKVWEVECLTFLIDIVKPTTGIWNLMTQNKNWNLLYT